MEFFRGGNTFDFTDISSGNGTICQYDWDFGDGTPITTTTAPTIRHSYTTAGPWRVCLTVTNCIYDPVTGALINSCADLKCMWVYPPQSMVGNPGSSTQVQQIQTQPADAQSQPSVTPVYELDKDKVLTVYPNPKQGSFVLSLYKHTGAYQVLVRDQQGREVYNRKHEFVNGSVQVTLNDVSNGVYSVEVINDSERYTLQISIIR